MVIIKMVQSMTKLIQSPPDVFRHQIERHFAARGLSMYERIKGWMEASNDFNNQRISEEYSRQEPKFSLVPASRGFCLTLNGLLETFRGKVEALRPVSEGSDL